MSSVQQSKFNHKKRSRLHLHHHLRRHVQQKFSQENPSLKNTLTKQDRQLIEQYVLSKLHEYSNKPRLWQLTHSSHIRKRLLDKSQYIGELYSLSTGSVYETINSLFQNVDKHVLRIRQLLRSTSKSSNNVFEKLTNTNHRWRLLQIERAQQILPDLNQENLTEDELLQKYSKYIVETLTPKSDPNNSNCIAQLRDQPFDLDNAYAKAEQKAKKHLAKILESHDRTPIPDLDLIEEIVNFGLASMKTRPTNDEFENATNFFSKISVLHRSKQAYEYGLQNMGDDFMLLRFGKIFGPDACPTTERINNQFIYLVHLFFKSISQLILLFETKLNDLDEISSTILTIIRGQISSQINPMIIKYPDDDNNSDELFSPKLSIDQWTWLFEKWLDALRTFPILLTNVGAFVRLLRTTIGIGIARIYHFAEKIIEENQLVDMQIFSEQIFHALQMGFYFGIAYAIVDCIQDEIRNIHQSSSLQRLIEANFNETNLSPVEILDKWLLIMEDLLSGKEYNRNEIPKTPLTPLLLETFDSLLTLSKTIDVTCSAFNELALLLRSQRLDKKSSEEFYSNEEIFLGAVLKSHFTYTCTTYLGNIQSAREESERLWIMPFLGQLTDDCRDFYDDLTSNSVTSFTQYESSRRHSQSLDKQLVNPFYVFLNLCINLYKTSHCDPQTGAFLGRRIARTLKSIEISNGESALRQFLHIFCHDNPSLHDYLWCNLRCHFPNVSDPEKTFFRMVHKESVTYARTNRKLETYAADHLQQIEDALKIHSVRTAPSSTLAINNRDEQLLISAMNYSVKAGGKRLRPLMMLMVADMYEITIKNILPLACSIEYLHTSSLIFDDLPAQDNSDLRRGKPTLHKTIINNDIPENLCEGRAQLAAVDLIAVSISVLNNDSVKNIYSAERVNQVISEISLSMHDLCIGQMMDLRAAHMGIEENNRQLEELDRIAWLKTGKAIEIVLIAPAILHGESTIEITRIRELSRLMGILFQMRDDLLDIEGENIGKPAALDVKNNTVTYVSVLGIDGTRQRLKEFRRDTLKLVDQCWPIGAGTFKDVVNYMVNRKN